MTLRKSMAWVLLLCLCMLAGCVQNQSTGSETKNSQRASTGNPAIDSMTPQELGVALVKALEERPAGSLTAHTGNPAIDSMTPEQLGDALLRALEERSHYKAAVEELREQLEALKQQD